MSLRSIAAMAVIATGVVAGTPASAQVAAEEAVILSGSSGQAAAQSSLGEAISGSINSAAQALRSANSASAGNTSRPGRTGYAGTIPEGDPLENSDAKTYQVQGGARLKLSGSFRPSRTTSCEKNCDTPPADAETPEAPASKPD